ncbi:MAG: DUF1573 domain-containing protein [Lishizhenia sp.]
MRLYFAIIFIALNSAFGFCQSAEFHFLDKTTVKLGKFKEGEKVTHTFTFTNSGEIPLVITNAKVSCTCTTIDFSKKPILPGDTSAITIHFDTKEKYYWQDRVVYIESNAKKEEKLRFKLYVEPEEN